jgi:hypothetical protein
MTKKITNYIVFLLIIVPVVVHLFLLKNFSLNFPFEDDHRVFMDFSYNYLNSKSLQEKISYLLTPDNESRPFLIRFSLLVPLSIFKNIDFKIILFFNNIYMVILLGVLLKKYKKYILFLPLISLTVLSLCVWELYFRNDVASYQLASISLSVLLFYWITKPHSLSKPLIRLLFFVIIFLVPFGSVVGFISVFMIIIYSFLRKTNPNWKILSLIFLFQLILYFSYASSFSGTNNSIFENLSKYNIELLLAYFISTGGQFQLFYNQLGFIISGTLGLMVLAFGAFYFFKNLLSDDYDFEKLVILFSAGSLGIIVLSRYNYWFVGYESVLGARYKIYGILIFLMAMFFVFIQLKNPSIKWLIIVFFSGLYVGWLAKTVPLLQAKNSVQLSDAFNLEQNTINNQKANVTYEARHKYDFLKTEGYFNPNDALEIINKKLNKALVVIPSGNELKYVDFDPAFESDWGGKVSKLSKLTLTGKFPQRNDYFVKVKDNNDKIVLLNIHKKPMPIYDRLFDQREYVSELSREFELEYYNLEAPFEFEVYCVN